MKIYSPSQINSQKFERNLELVAMLANLAMLAICFPFHTFSFYFSILTPKTLEKLIGVVNRQGVR